MISSRPLRAGRIAGGEVFFPVVAIWAAFHTETQDYPSYGACGYRRRDLGGGERPSHFAGRNGCRDGDVVLRGATWGFGVNWGLRLHIYTRLHTFAPNFAPRKTAGCRLFTDWVNLLANSWYVCTGTDFTETERRISPLQSGSPFPVNGVNEYSDQYISLHISLR